MSVLLTNIKEKSFNEDLINLSMEKIDFKSLSPINEICFINENSQGLNWNISNLIVRDFPVSTDVDIEKLYQNVEKIIEKVFSKKEFVNLIVDTSFLAYVILEIAIKKFNITKSFIFENGEIKPSHPCSCESDYMGM